MKVWINQSDFAKQPWWKIISTNILVAVILCLNLDCYFLLLFYHVIMMCMCVFVYFRLVNILPVCPLRSESWQ